MTASDERTIPAARVVFSESDRAEIASRIDTALSTGALTLGSNTRELEASFAALHEMPYAVAVSSGTAALEIILRAVGVAGREVIVPANTFAATAFAVLGAGGRPVFADVDPASFAVSPQTVEAVMTPETAAVVMVHIGGLVSPEVVAISKLCKERGVAFVEDAAHAIGCTYRGRYAGSFGVAGSFSFYPTKVITSGEGGIIVTADERLRDEALAYRDQGKAGFLGNLHVRQGYAWRISELHAAVGLVHLRRLPEFLVVRQRIAARYTRELAAIPGLTVLEPPADGTSNFYKFIALLPDGVERPALKSRLRDEHGVSLSGEVYETPLHQQPIFEELSRGRLPVAERICARHICLPLHSDMADDEADQVISALREVLA